MVVVDTLRWKEVVARHLNLLVVPTVEGSLVVLDMSSVVDTRRLVVVDMQMSVVDTWRLMVVGMLSVVDMWRWHFGNLEKGMN